MSEDTDWKNRWQGLRPEAREALDLRSYEKGDLAARLLTGQVNAGELAALDRGAPEMIPGVEVVSRNVYHQRHRGFFAEFAREGEGVAGEIGFWPKQWATARMYGGTAKGFHIHPPHIPEGEEPGAWFQKLFVDEPDNFAARPYDKEQWDMMFFIAGNVEFFLSDERVGMPRKIMRFIIDGDDSPRPNNCAVIIPSGVAHALRCASGGDAVMVYGTSTTFDPANEGRINSDIEAAPAPEDWQHFLDGA